MKKIDWQRVGDWLSIEGQMWALGLAAVIFIVGLVFGFWPSDE